MDDIGCSAHLNQQWIIGAWGYQAESALFFIHKTMFFSRNKLASANEQDEQKLGQFLPFLYLYNTLLFIMNIFIIYFQLRRHFAWWCRDVHLSTSNTFFSGELRVSAGTNGCMCMCIPHYINMPSDLDVAVLITCKQIYSVLAATEIFV